MKKMLLILFAGIVLYSCNPLTVLNEYNKSIDFTQYKTMEFYGWTDGDIFGNMYSKKRMESAFRNEFKKRGVELVKKGEGDIIISLYMVSEKRTETFTQTQSTYIGGSSRFGIYGGYGYGYGMYYGFGPGYSWGPGYTITSATQGERVFNEGTLIISAFDAKKEELIWETVAMKTTNLNSHTMDDDIKRAIKKIMKTYPVKN